MTATLDADQELVHFSFPISKQEDTDSINPVDGTPDIWIVGKATDGTVDAHRQIVDPEWSASALREWAATGGNVRMAHDPKRPVGKGHDVQVTMDGHYVKSLISDPLAKHFIRTGVLNDYSVGISMPHVKFGPHKGLDPRGEATGGIITGRPDGLSKIAELSVVDRGSNFHSKFQIAKSAGGGEEFTGRMVGDEDEIAMAAPPGLLAKALGEPQVVKGGDGASAPGEMVSVDLPADMPLSVSPAMLAKMNTLSRQRAVGLHYGELAVKAVAEAEDAVLGKDHREFSAEERRHQASQGNSLPDGSYPIPDKDALRRAAILARSGHGNVAAARRLIARRAKELGVANPLDEGDEVKKSGSDEKGQLAGMLGAADRFAAAVAVAHDQAGAQKAVDQLAADLGAVKEADPDVTKEPEGAPAEPKPEPVKKAKGKPKGKKKLPPWLNKPSDGDSGDGKGSSGGDGACKSVSDHLWTGVEGTSDIVCSKCHTTPAEAAGVTASPMDPAPVGDLMESTMPASVKGATPQSASGAKDAPAMQPVPRHREPDGAETEAFEKDSGMSDGDNEAPTRLEAPTLKASPEVSALLRFRSIGIDPELGKLHDLTCPAFHPDDVQRFHPFADIAGLIDAGAWQRKALEAACGPIEHMLKMHELEQAAVALKSADEADLNQWRLDAHKAFRDANPGPSTYPSPGAISPQKYNRPLLEAGRAATSTGHAGPNTSPQVATVAPNAHDFSRPPLADAHASPSPSFMKAGFPYPAQQGMPVQLTYARQVQEQQHAALEQMHSHLGAMYPAVCPMDLNAPAPEMRHPVPATAGIGKAEGGNVAALPLAPADPAKVPQVPVPTPLTKAAPAAGELVDAGVYKGFKKHRKKLGKRVLAGKMTVDEARAKMGRRFAQKAAGEAVQKAAAPDLSQSERVTYQGGALTPDLIKAAVRDAFHVETVPLEAATIEAYDPGPAIEAAVTKAVTPLLEKIQATDTKLAEAQRVIDAIADQPDPATASFSGLAFSPVRKSRPAGVTDIAETAERSRQMMIRHMESTVNSASDPYEREAARASLERLRGGA